MALDEWVKKAAVSGVNMLIKFSKTIAAHRSGILAYFDFDGLSTGPLEGTNNKIKLAQNNGMDAHYPKRHQCAKVVVFKTTEQERSVRHEDYNNWH